MKIFFFVLISFMLCGCGMTSKFDYFNSTLNVKSGVDNTLIADDMFTFMSTYYLPNKTNLYITTSDFNKKFYNYLVQKFREKGYAVTDDSTIKNLTFFSYAVKGDEHLIFVTYNINDSKINRLYTTQDDKLVRVGETTVFNFLLQEPIVETPKTIQKPTFILSQNVPEVPVKNEIVPEVKTEKPKATAKVPVKKSISSLELKKQKPFVPASAPKETKIPIAIGEDGKPFVESEKRKDEDVVMPLVMVEEVKPIETPKIDHNVSVVAQEVKPITVVETNPIPQKPIEKTNTAADNNVSVDTKVAAAIEGLKNTPQSETEAALKSETRVNVNPIKNDAKITKNDVNDTQKNVNDTSIAKNDANNTKTDPKPAIEPTVILDRPFDTNTSENAPAQKELGLIETIEEALGVYPDVNEEKLRADLMREVVKFPHIDAQAVKTMPLKKGLLLQLLKVAKEKQ